MCIMWQHWAHEECAGAGETYVCDFLIKFHTRS